MIEEPKPLKIKKLEKAFKKTDKSI